MVYSNGRRNGQTSGTLCSLTGAKSTIAMTRAHPSCAVSSFNQAPYAHRTLPVGTDQLGAKNTTARVNRIRKQPEPEPSIVYIGH